MCICINCLYLNECSVYHFVKLNHNGGNLNINENTFNFKKPKQTMIKIENKILNQNSLIFLKDIDVNECTNFLELPGNWENF